jgi:hypothetical protein
LESSAGKQISILDERAFSPSTPQEHGHICRFAGMGLIAEWQNGFSQEQSITRPHRRSSVVKDRQDMRIIPVMHDT